MTELSALEMLIFSAFQRNCNSIVQHDMEHFVCFLSNYITKMVVFFIPYVTYCLILTRTDFRNTMYCKLFLDFDYFFVLFESEYSPLYSFWFHTMYHKYEFTVSHFVHLFIISSVLHLTLYYNTYHSLLLFIH